MKEKISITIDGNIVKDIEKALISGRFRNKSHFIEYAVKRLLDCEKTDNQESEGQLRWD